MKRFIQVRTTFTALHAWENMPKGKPHGYLKFPHRHIFHVLAVYEVTHNDRDLEFFDEIDNLDSEIQQMIAINYGDSDFDDQISYLPMSCEMMAEWLFIRLSKRLNYPVSISVGEDGENWATVCQDNVYPLVLK